MALGHSGKPSRAGFTLVEMMVVLVILGIITIAAIAGITGQSRFFHQEEELLGAQMNARLAMDRICSIIHAAGCGCYDSFGPDLTSGSLATCNDTSDPDVAPNPLTSLFLISNNTPPASDRLTVAAALRYIGAISGIPSSNQITLGNVPKDVLGSKIDPTEPAKANIFISPNDDNRYRTISALAAKTLTLSSGFSIDRENELKAALNAIPPVEINVYQVQAFTIRVVNANLRIDGNLAPTSTQSDIADGIECLQFRYGIDTSSPADGTIDSWVDNPAKIARIRAVRIFILARTSKIDRNYTDRRRYTMAGITIGPFNDHYHRYLLRSTAVIRNRSL